MTGGGAEPQVMGQRARTKLEVSHWLSCGAQ